MAIVWLDGFENYSNTIDDNINDILLSRYVNRQQSWTIASPRTANTKFSSKASTPAASTIRTPIFDLQTTWIIGIGLYFDSLANSNLISVYLGESLQGILAVRNDTKQLYFDFGSVDTKITVSNLFSNNWFYLEMKLTLASGATGSYEIRVDGKTVASATGVDITNTSSAGANNFVITNPGYIDDLYICDDTGSFNNDFLGDIGINGYVPVADGATNSWLPDTGTDNFSRLEDIGTTNSFVSTTVAGRDLFIMGQRPGSSSTIETIEALQINVLGRKEGLGFKRVQTVIVSDPVGTDTPAGPIEELGDTQWLADTYTVQWQASDVDPRTGSSWEINDIINGNVHFGFQLL